MVPRRLITVALLFGACCAGARPALAQSVAADAAATAPSAELRVNLPATLFTSGPPAIIVQAPAPVVPAATPVAFRDTSAANSASIVSLCTSMVVLQALDVRSTYAVIEHGGAEGNPVLAGVVPNKAAFIAMKAGVAVSTIFAARKVATHNKAAAVLMLVAFNSVYATVVAHNFHLASQLR